ncbi:MAG: hypothetical protein J0I42_13440 [Bosea sp.]|uniref:hypothetical protein n=1 Tax=Bosea sp. (in: a-proteobacteria) TaxID=1871050 RepID=UPI001AC27525|nr:hypothetical protein [Bosea sp. (in: a-proteobacteria)]MBN9452946.1 hypothetical protein [Bosea sp. (in: a-proteobacteria)]
MTITRMEFEKRIATAEYTGSRNRARRVASLVLTSLQGRSNEAFQKLLPKLQNSPDVPSTAVAKAILVLAQQWLGDAAVKKVAPQSLPETAPPERERYVAMTAKALLATGDLADEAVAREIAEMGYDYFIRQDLLAVKKRSARHALTNSLDRLHKAAANFGTL